MITADSAYLYVTLASQYLAAWYFSLSPPLSDAPPEDMPPLEGEEDEDASRMEEVD